MYLFALDSWWNDFYTAGGFYVGVMGAVVGIAGFWIAIKQIRETKRAALAAKGASEKTLAESKESHERFVGAFASRLLSELQRAVNEKDWTLSAARAHDLAEVLATVPNVDAANVAALKSLRYFGQLFSEMLATNRKQLSATVQKDRWKPVVELLHTRLDQLRAPFRERHDDHDRTHRTDHPAPETASDRSEPPRQDDTGRGELDADGNQQ